MRVLHCVDHLLVAKGHLMTWYALALISAIALATQVVLMRTLQRWIPIQVYIGFMWLGSGLVLTPFVVTSRWDMTRLTVVLPLLAIAGLASWAGNLVYNVALKSHANPGYIEALSGVRLVLAYVASLALFDAHLTLAKLLAMVGAGIGLALVSMNSAADTRGENKSSWVVFALLAGVLFALLIITVKYLSIQGLSGIQTVWAVFLIAGVLYLASAVRARQSLRIPYVCLPILLIGIATAALGNLALFMSYYGAPNLAYPEAISNGRVVLLYLFGIASATEKVKPLKLFAVALTFACIVVLAS